MSKNKFRVGVLMGGPSTEREISLVTGEAIYNKLDRSKYLPSKIEMTRDRHFDLLHQGGRRRRRLDFLNQDRKLFDIIFVALHGSPGEDGTVQGMLDALDIPYTGSGMLSSALAMNKVFTAQVYRANGLNTPRFEHIKYAGWKEYRDSALSAVLKRVGLPCVVKPVDQGSAVGVSIIKSAGQLGPVIDKTIKEFPWLMVQKFIAGAEATCGVLASQVDRTALPPTHILPVLGDFYDYKAKYAKGGSTHVCPADFSLEINNALRKLALLAHTALRCRGMSRTDFIVSDAVIKSGKVRADKKNSHVGDETSDRYFTPGIFILETNTIPGMTSTSLFPEAAAKAGISFSQMLDAIIGSSL